MLRASGELLVELASDYPRPFVDPLGWQEGVVSLCRQLPQQWRSAVAAIAVDGTSGTLLLTQPDGCPLGQALPYYHSVPEQAQAAADLVGSEGSDRPAASASGSLARALALIARHGAGRSSVLLRHQADWLSGWLLADWRWGEETNNLRLGWDQTEGRWLGAIAHQPWSGALPDLRPAGAPLGHLAPGVAAELGLPESCLVVAGCTDASAAVLAADPQPGDGVTVLGTTLVLKQFSPAPVQGPGISCQHLAGRWLVGGASNAGAGVLRQFFDDALLAELSRQIDPRCSSGLELRPLPRRGERFPVDDPLLEPILEPRPVSDALYLQALLEGLARVESQGWAALEQRGAPAVTRVLSLGGGARNPQWRAIRQRILGVPVLNRPHCSAAQGMARLALSALSQP